MSSTRILRVIAPSIHRFGSMVPVRKICGYSATPDAHMRELVAMHFEHVHADTYETLDVLVAHNSHVSAEQNHHVKHKQHNHHGEHEHHEKRHSHHGGHEHHEKRHGHHGGHEHHEKRHSHHGEHEHHVKDRKSHSHVEDSHKEPAFKAW